MSETTPETHPNEAYADPAEAPQETPEAAPAPEKPGTGAEGHETPDEPVQPAEADPDTGAEIIQLHPERGALALRPNQTTLDANQVAALVAIGIDVKKDPLVEPHIRPFIHMCQTKGLDPWAREAYLIGRGRGENRKFTMQTGIDGYRKMANSTGKFIRVKERLWTGRDDDDRSYWRDENGVMRRVWYDQWPESRGYPGAAKVVIEHYDETGKVVESEAVADWGMYAPMNDVWTGPSGNRKKKIGEDGKVVQEVAEMWQRGGPHMLSKCAEALCDRIAFPARMSGVYTHEEMHRLDQIERNRLQAEQRTARQNAMHAKQEQPALPPASDPFGPAGPIPVGDVAEEVTDALREEAEAEPEVPDEEQRVWLLAELDFQAEILGHKVAKLAARPMRALRKNVEDFTPAELLPLVLSLRPGVLARLQEVERPEAETYVNLPERAVDIDTVLVHDGELVEDPDTEAEAEAEEHNEPVTDDPDKEHLYLDLNGECQTCGLAEDVGPHPE